MGGKRRNPSLNDWEELINAVEHTAVRGNRTRLKRHLIELEQNPNRTIQRLLRIIHECCHVTGSELLLDHVNPTGVEAVVVGALGSHQFQEFCSTLALIVKMDYGLNFFKAIVCATIRRELNPKYRLEAEKSWNRLTATEATGLRDLGAERKQSVVTKITALFVKVIHGIVLRYASILVCSEANPYRFGLQMRDLTLDDNIRESVINFLCVDENREHVALTWLADEVTIWSMD